MFSVLSLNVVISTLFIIFIILLLIGFELRFYIHKIYQDFNEYSVTDWAKLRPLHLNLVRFWCIASALTTFLLMLFVVLSQ